MTVLLGEMICPTCYQAEPKTRCSICGLEKRFVADGGGTAHSALREPQLQRLNVPGAERKNVHQSEAENTVGHVRKG